jgi:signal transduction histidine kinase/putative methionine-R-sulfoxide reductase with GAF domain
MKKNRKDAPSEAEARLKSELERARGQIQMLRKGATSDAEGAAPRRDSAAPGEAPKAGSLEARIVHLEKTRERLSKLYFSQLDENRRRASKLHEILRMVSEINTSLNLETLLERLVTTIQNSLGFRIALIRLREPGSEHLRAAGFAGLGPGARAVLEANDVPVEQFLSWLKDDFQVSRSYFISHKESFSRTLPPGYVPDLGRREEWEWHAEDVLLVPLFDSRGDLLAYFSVDDPVDRLVPSQEAVEMLEIFGHHAVGAIENARLYRQLEARTGELELADQRMQEMNHLKSQFVSTISHELRTPLTAIRAYVDTLLATGLEDVPPERVRQCLTVINDEGQRLARLIESALDLSRLDSGHSLAVRQKVDFGELLEESAWLLSRMAETRQVELKLDREVVDTHVDADRDQIRQLVLHLVSNAIKFTPAGGHVEVRLTGDERVVTLRVEDTGIGIPEEALEKVFDRFYQVESSLARRYGGTGLGLAICKSIVEWHGGEIDAVSRPGEGSCFTVRLPRHTGPQVMLRPDSALSVVTRDVLRLAVEMVSEVMDAGVVSLMTPAKDGSLVIEAAIGLETNVVRDARVRPGVGVAGAVARDRRPMCVSQPEQGAAGSGRESYRTGTFLSVPLAQDGVLFGVLNVTDPVSQRPFQIEDCNLLLELADSIARAWREALGSETQRDRVAGTAEAMRRVLEHVRKGRHSAPDRVRLAQSTAQSLRLAAPEVALVAFAAAVHDVGMTLVDRGILEGGRRLEPAERATMQRHVELGAEVLERLEALSNVREIVLSHHEWWDGSGYPCGLQGAEIPRGARVLAVVDAYESMTLGRAHRAPLERREAVAELVKLRGKQFDPEVVDAFVRILPRAERAPAAAQVPAAS